MAARGIAVKEYLSEMLLGCGSAERDAFAGSVAESSEHSVPVGEHPVSDLNAVYRKLSVKVHADNLSTPPLDIRV